MAAANQAALPPLAPRATFNDEERVETGVDRDGAISVRG